jgi:hypothetical protein
MSQIRISVTEEVKNMDMMDLSTSEDVDGGSWL